MHEEIDFYVESCIELQNLRRDGILCDVKLTGKSGKRGISAHKVVLASQSSYFKAMFTTNMIECTKEEIVLESIDDDIIEKIISYCYTGDILLTPSDVEDILDAAHMFGIRRISDKCFAYLHNNLDISNCYGIAYLAEKYSCSEMQKIAEDYTVQNFRLVMNSMDFSCIIYENLVKLISHNQLNVSSECEVYEAVIRWVKHKTEDRKMYLKELLSYVRFPLLTRKFLIDKVAKEDLIISNPECRDYLYSALDYHLVPERRNLSDKEQNRSARRSLTNTIYVIGGENRTGPLRTVEMFQLNSKSWHRCPSLSVARKHAAVTILGGMIYCAGGIDDNGNDLSTVEVFDPASKIWSSAAKLNLCKGALSITVLDGWLYATGGSNGGSALKYTERYDPGRDEWTSVQQMRFPRSHFGMGTLNNKLYVIGGYSGICEVEHCEVFDPLTTQWKDLADLNKPRMNHAVSVHSDKIFAVGGCGHSGILDCIEKYNKGLSMWLIIKHTLDPRSGANVSLVKTENDENWLFIVGGIDGSYCFHSSVKMLNLKSIDYSIGSGKAMIEPRAYGGTVAL